jgi:glycerol-3-phosphate cytidylyltransferase
VKKVITYGTYDLLHYGHVNLLQRAKSLGDYLIVALSTDEFNHVKGKPAPYFSYERRKQLLLSIRYVDLVIPERSWEQKLDDIARHDVATFVIGDDWRGKFDFLMDVCEVVYLERTPEISTTRIKTELGVVSDPERQLPPSSDVGQ